MNKLDTPFVDVGLTERGDEIQPVAPSQPTDFRLDDDVVAQRVGWRVGVDGEQVRSVDDRRPAVNHRQAGTRRHQSERLIVNLCTRAEWTQGRIDPGGEVAGFLIPPPKNM